MSLLHREPRKMKRDRDGVELRDTRLFLIACDDTYAPQQYFEFLKLPRIKILVVPTEDSTSTPLPVLKRLEQRAKQLKLDEEDEKWLVLDTDRLIQGAKQKDLMRAIQQARQKGIQVALSRPCFELWLLLHHLDETAVPQKGNCGEIEAALRAVHGEYNKTHLKEEHYPNGSATEAILRAERMDLAAGGGDIPATHATRVYRLMRAIAKKGLPSLVPDELRHI